MRWRCCPTRAGLSRAANHCDARTGGARPARADRCICSRPLARRACRSTLSRDAGRYLCNYLCWRAAEAAVKPGGPRLAAFVHVPPLRRKPRPRRAKARLDADGSCPRRHAPVVNADRGGAALTHCLRALAHNGAMAIDRRTLMPVRWPAPPLRRLPRRPKPRRCRNRRARRRAIRAAPGRSPTTRAPSCNAPSTRRRARACRFGSRPASTAPAVSRLRPARRSPACAAQPGSCSRERPSLLAAEHAEAISLSRPELRRRRRQAAGAARARASQQREQAAHRRLRIPASRRQRASALEQCEGEVAATMIDGCRRQRDLLARQRAA